MKTRIVKNKEMKEPVFKPFTLEITVETIQEARALYHVANRERSAKLCTENNYSISLFSDDFNIDAFPGFDTVYIIGNEVESQGFKI